MPRDVNGADGSVPVAPDIRRAAPWWALIGVLAILTGYAVWLQRGFSFVVDEWDILAHHFDGKYLTPYNGHLSIIPVGIYQLLAHTVGLGSYRLYGVIGIVIFMAIPLVFFCTHRHPVDERLAALAAAGIAWSWAAQSNVLYAFLMNFDIPVLMLVIAWWLIRHERRAYDLWAMGALCVALASSSVGVVVAFAIGIELICRRVPLRRLMLFAPPVIAWLVWWAFRHEAIKPASLGDRISYAWNVGVAILSGFTLGWKPGAALVGVALAAIAVLAWRRWHTLDAHVVAIALTCVFFIALSAWSRAGDIALNPPDAARYVWIGDVLIIAGLCWCVRGVRIDVRALAAVALVVLIGAVGLIGHLGDYRNFVLEYTARTRPALAEAEAAGSHADRSRILPLNLIPVTVGEYLALVRSVGSPISGLSGAALGSETARVQADTALGADLDLRVTPVAARGSCASGWKRLEPYRAGRGVAVPGPGTLAVTAPPGHKVALRVRWLARQFPDEPLGTVRAGTTATVRFPPIHSSRPWFVTTTGAAHAAFCADG